MLSTLPPELISTIINYCTPTIQTNFGKADLAELALVSHAFLDPVRKALYPTVVLDFVYNPATEILAAARTLWSEDVETVLEEVLAIQDSIHGDDIQRVTMTWATQKLHHTLCRRKNLRDMVRVIKFAHGPDDRCSLEDERPVWLATMLALCPNVTTVDACDPSGENPFVTTEVLLDSDRSFTSLELPQAGNTVALLEQQSSLKKLGVVLDDTRSMEEDFPASSKHSFQLSTLQIISLSDTSMHNSGVLHFMARSSHTSLHTLHFDTEGFTLGPDDLKPFVNLSHFSVNSRKGPVDLLPRVVNAVSQNPNLCALSVRTEVDTRACSLDNIKSLRRLPNIQSLTLSFSVYDCHTFSNFLYNPTFLPRLSAFVWITSDEMEDSAEVDDAQVEFEAAFLTRKHVTMAGWYFVF